MVDGKSPVQLGARGCPFLIAVLKTFRAPQVVQDISHQHIFQTCMTPKQCPGFSFHPSLDVVGEIIFVPGLPAFGVAKAWKG